MRDGTFGVAGYITGHERPQHETGDVGGDGHEEHSPFDPEVFVFCGENTHDEESDETRDKGEGHEVDCILGQPENNRNDTVIRTS